MMEIGAAVLAGLVAGLGFLIVVWDAIVGGLFDPPFLEVLGTRVAPHASRRGAYLAGAGVHTSLSIGFALAYAWLLDALSVTTVVAGAAVGLMLGLAHAALATLVVGAALARARRTEPPAPAGRLTLGTHARAATTVWILAHAIFGLTVGTVYLATAG